MTRLPDVGTAAAPLELIARIHGTDTRCVLVVTGGGVASLSWLLGVPGASRTVLEGTVPYATTALTELIGYEPAQAVSAATAEAMARAAMARAGKLDPDGGVPLVGVAATAALVSDRPKRGEHRAQVAVADKHGVRSWSLVLDKGRRGRTAEDALVSHLVVAALADACGIATEPLAGLGPGDVLTAPQPQR